MQSARSPLADPALFPLAGGSPTGVYCDAYPSIISHRKSHAWSGDESPSQVTSGESVRRQLSTGLKSQENSLAHSYPVLQAMKRRQPDFYAFITMNDVAIF